MQPTERVNIVGKEREPMHSDAQKALPVEGLAAAFEHSITWEDDVWSADPVDVELVHQPARRKFADTLKAVRTGKGHSQSRILLFHGHRGRPRPSR